MKQTTGLKDHEIAGLVNAVRDNLKAIIPHQCLRELIHQSVTGYLEKNQLRIDRKDN